MNFYGDGRVVYLPKIEPAPDAKYAATSGTGYRDIPPAQWKLPANWNELVEAVEWACGGNLSLKVYAPLTVVAELLMKTDKTRMMLHLVNFDNNALGDLNVDLRIPFERKIRKVMLLSPDFEKKIPLKFNEVGDRIFFKVPKLIIYDLILIQLE